MHLVRLLWSTQRWRLVLVILACLSHTVLNIAMIALVGFYTTQSRRPPHSWASFLLLMASTVITQTLAVTLSDRMAHEMSSRLRKSLLQSILGAPLEQIELWGGQRFLTAFIDDTQRVAGSVPLAINFVRDISFIGAMFAYLLWLSPRMMTLLVAVMVLGVGIFYPMRKLGTRYALEQRGTAEKAFGTFRDVVDGIKQIKTNEVIKKSLTMQLEQCHRESVRLGQRMGWCFAAGTQSAVLLFFSCLLIFTYVRVDAAAGASVLSVYVIGLMLLLTPLLSLAQGAQQLGVAGIALSRITEVMAPGRAESIAQLEDETTRAAAGVWTAAITSVELRDVCHTYLRREREEFAMGPVNVRINSGEALFVVGGNGTGKTTLVKIIAGLYAPTAGDMLVNGVAIDSHSRTWFREHVSAVFSDSCLFEALAGSSYDRQLGEDRAGLLKSLRLETVIARDKSLLGQAASCSSGERKRLAFLLSYYADRPIFIFDEFGADQDPTSKDLFYCELIEELKRRRKIVIVVTHDDRYFEQGEQVLELERGRPPRLWRRGMASEQGSRLRALHEQQQMSG
jgi:putative pyoverdin transport system ATP-binding/permease protein